MSSISIPAPARHDTSVQAGVLNVLAVGLSALAAGGIGQLLGGDIAMCFALFILSAAVQWYLLIVTAPCLGTMGILYVGVIADYFVIMTATNDVFISVACAAVGLCMHFIYLAMRGPVESF